MITLQQLIDRLIEIRDEEHISGSAPVLLIEDALPHHENYKGYNIQISEDINPEDYKYVVCGNDGYIEHGDRPSEADHSVHIYWEAV